MLARHVLNGAILAVLAAVVPISAQQAARPDVLFIAVDDLNDWIGVLGGHPQAKTPNIDLLAKRGMLFSNAHTAAPSCNPSRAALMTGVLPSTSGVYSNAFDWRRAPALRDKPTLPQYLRGHGYKAMRGGKIYHAWSFTPDGFIGTTHPPSWDVGYPSLNRQMPEEIRPLYWPINRNPGLIYGMFDWAPVGAEDWATADGQVVSWARRRLLEKRDEALFLAVGIYRPHLPWYVPQRYFDMHPIDKIELPAVLADDLDDVPRYARRGSSSRIHKWVVENDHWKKAVQGYLASISFADAMVGRLIDALDQSGKADKTIVVLWSDHGWHLGEKGYWRKFSLWEEATHVPLIVVAPGVTAAGSQTAKPVSLMDLYPTLCELAGVAVPKHTEGFSLVPLLKDANAQWDHAAVTSWGYQNHSVRGERYRYIRYEDGGEELYDHRIDPHEHRNLAANPDLAARKAALAKHLPTLNARPLAGLRLLPGGLGAERIE